MRKKEITIETPVIREYFALFDIKLEELEGQVITIEMIKNKEIMKKYEENNFKQKLQEEIASTQLTKLKKNYQLRNEKDLITICRFILRRINYDIKMIKEMKDKQMHTSYIITKKKKIENSVF